MITRITKQEIRSITSIPVEDITEHDRDEMAIPTYTHPNPLIRWLMWRRYDRLADMLEGNASGAALEFGCGIGLFLPELSKQYGKVYAMDLFPQYARRLAKEKEITVNFIAIMDEIDDESLDVIIAADVLEHLDELDSCLRQFQRKLKKGGQFLVSGPTESAVYKLGRVLAGFAGKGDYHYTNIYRLLDRIEESGFSKGETINLPFPVLPPLFQLCHFRKPH
ncbi:MAG: class I SAM-dependent methyltransferase [Thiotrichales bacterium]|nr:class I SAM-dependent methyltransferase [Thiotrichales bacterium]